MTGFDAQPTLQGFDLKLAPLCEADRDEMIAAAGHREIWAGHPVPDRYRPDVFDPYFDLLLGLGGALSIRDDQTGEVIGTSAYYAAPDQDAGISIGYTFLTHTRWGGTTNFSVKRLMHGHALKTTGHVWYHIAPTNFRSQKATTRLGAEFKYDAVLNLTGSPTEFKCYSVSRDRWDRILKQHT